MERVTRPMSPSLRERSLVATAELLCWRRSALLRPWSRLRMLDARLWQDWGWEMSCRVHVRQKDGPNPDESRILCGMSGADQTRVGGGLGWSRRRWWEECPGSCVPVSSIGWRRGSYGGGVGWCVWPLGLLERVQLSSIADLETERQFDVLARYVEGEVVLKFLSNEQPSPLMKTIYYFSTILMNLTLKKIRDYFCKFFRSSSNAISQE